MFGDWRRNLIAYRAPKCCRNQINAGRLTDRFAPLCQRSKASWWEFLVRGRIANRDGMVNHEESLGDVDEHSLALTSCFPCPR